MSPEVQLDQDVFDFLKTKAEPFTDTPNSVLRRLLNLESKPGKITAEAEGKAIRPIQSRVRAVKNPRPKAIKTGKRGSAKDPEKRPRAASGTLLPESIYELPLLRALVDLGGQAPYREVSRKVGEDLKDQFLPADLEQLRSGGIRWQSRLQFARLRAVERGYLEKDSPRGVWEITDAGRSALLKAVSGRGDSDTSIK